MVLMILGTFGLSLYSLTWPWMISKSTWGQLMEQYSIILNKIDVARGRCVPVPSKLMHSSRFSIPNSPLNMLHRSSSKTSLERIVDALNPYTASPNIRLILDMIAYKSGLGVALRNLAFLEIDVHNNWRPFRPQINFVASTSEAINPQLTLEVSWKDPLALLYLKPVPNELQVHYGIEIEYGNVTDVQKLVEIVGYQETRYFRQIWHYQHHGSISSVEGSTLTLTQDKNIHDENEGFSYRELFQNVHPKTHETIKVSVWTIIDGQLIAKSTVTYLEDEEVEEIVTPPKPPRLALEPTENKSEENSEGEKALNIQVTCINESKLPTTKKIKKESPPPPPPKVVKNRAKSLTNLKKSMKKKHRLSGENIQDSNDGILRKSKSVGNTLPFKSRDDFSSIQTKVSF